MTPEQLAAIPPLDYEEMRELANVVSAKISNWSDTYIPASISTDRRTVMGADGQVYLHFFDEVKRGDIFARPFHIPILESIVHVNFKILERANLRTVQELAKHKPYRPLTEGYWYEVHGD